MKKILSIALLVFSGSCYSQDNKGTIKVKKVETAKVDTIESSIIIPDTIYNPKVIARLTIVEKMPTFPGGPKEMDNFIQKNLKKEYTENKKGIKGTVWITFVVAVDGSISEVVIIKEISGCSGCSQEASRIVKMMPKWNPGMQNGRTVEVQFNLPIQFQL